MHIIFTICFVRTFGCRWFECLDYTSYWYASSTKPYTKHRIVFTPTTTPFDHSLQLMTINKYICYRIATDQNLKNGVGHGMILLVIWLVAAGTTLLRIAGKFCRMCSSASRSSLHLSFAARCDTSLRKTTQTRLTTTSSTSTAITTRNLSQR
jgi:hypothetical protein